MQSVIFRTQSFPFYIWIANKLCIWHKCQKGRSAAIDRSLLQLPTEALCWACLCLYLFVHVPLNVFVVPRDDKDWFKALLRPHAAYKPLHITMAVLGVYFMSIRSRSSPRQHALRLVHTVHGTNILINRQPTCIYLYNPECVFSQKPFRIIYTMDISLARKMVRRLI